MNRRHGHTRRNAQGGTVRTPEYASWEAMKARCLNPRHDQYAYYGGRGITICAAWAHDFAAFLHDMGPRPSRAHTLDRVDRDKDYGPSNCRWATKSEQVRNRSITKLTAQDADWIRFWVAQGHRQREIAKAFGVSEAQVSRVKNGRQWREAPHG